MTRTPIPPSAPARKVRTARELARLIGVSQSAVSRAFTPGKSISPALREHILTSAREVDYQPNTIASMLSRQRTNITAIVVSNLQNPFYPALIEKLTRGLQTIGLQSLMFNITRESDVDEQLVALRRYNVDSVLVLSATVLSGETLRRVTEGRSVILVNRVTPEVALNSICCDNATGAREIAEHFHAIGRRRVAFVGGLPKTTTSLERQQEFVARSAELGLTLTARLSGGEYSYEAGYKAALEIGRAAQTDAIFFANDILAIGGIDALRDELGLRIPEDIAVAGFDDIAMASWPRYVLTTYRQPVEAIVEQAIALLRDDAVRPDRPAQTYIHPGQLIIRNSTIARA